MGCLCRGKLEFIHTVYNIWKLKNGPEKWSVGCLSQGKSAFIHTAYWYPKIACLHMYIILMCRSCQVAQIIIYSTNFQILLSIFIVQPNSDDSLSCIHPPTLLLNGKAQDCFACFYISFEIISHVNLKRIRSCTHFLWLKSAYQPDVTYTVDRMLIGALDPLLSYCPGKVSQLPANFHGVHSGCSVEPEYTSQYLTSICFCPKLFEVTRSSYGLTVMCNSCTLYIWSVCSSV